jgi:hypothetical protein
VPLWNGLATNSMRLPDQFGADGVERGWVVQVETDGLIGGVAFEIDHGVVACVAAHGDLVAAEIRRLALTGDELQADDVGGEADRAVEVGRADAHVTDVVQVDHGEGAFRSREAGRCLKQAANARRDCNNVSWPAKAGHSRLCCVIRRAGGWQYAERAWVTGPSPVMTRWAVSSYLPATE